MLNVPPTESAVENPVTKAEVFEFASPAERKEALTKIIRGETKISVTKTHYDTKNATWMNIELEELPDYATRLRAIAELNKMCGDYQPAKPEPEPAVERTIVIRPRWLNLPYNEERDETA
jgi:hypothetical protein